MAQLQEAQFACFEDEELDSNTALLGSASGSSDFAAAASSYQIQPHQQSTTGVKTFTISGPNGSTRSLPQKSFARGKCCGECRTLCVHDETEPFCL